MNAFECDETLTGSIVNFPHRRACHPQLFFLEIKEVLDEKEGKDDTRRTEHYHVLFKHGQGGIYENGEELVELRRNLRQGDIVCIHVGRQEKVLKRNNKDNASIIEWLWHATKADVISVHINGNTGSSYQCSVVAPRHGGGNADGKDGSRVVGHAILDCTASNIPSAPLSSFLEEEEEEEEKEQHVPSKKERFAIFCDFLIATFGGCANITTTTTTTAASASVTCFDDDKRQRTTLENNHIHSNNIHFCDIAGGRGELALLLTLKGWRVTLIDPRENSGRLSSRSRKQLRKSGREAFVVERSFFTIDQITEIIVQEKMTAGNTTNSRDNNSTNDRHENSINTRPQLVLVGLHPDEATEVIVDAAVKYRLPFAVVPCCVYSRLFPHRRYHGQPVRTHEQFCRYLQAKAPGICRKELDFGGQATVLYHLLDYDEA